MLRAELRSLVTNVGCLLSELPHSGQIRHRSAFFFLASFSTHRCCNCPKQLQRSLEVRNSLTLTVQKRLAINFRVPTPFAGAKCRVCEERLQSPYATTASEPNVDAVLSRSYHFRHYEIATTPKSRVFFPYRVGLSTTS